MVTIIKGERHLMKVLVIGATGTIGQAVVALLHKTHNVVKVGHHHRGVGTGTYSGKYRH